MEIGAPILALIYNALKDIVNGMKNEISIEQQSSLTLIENHIIEISNWSSQIQFLGMAEALDVSSHTLPLRISNTPRKYFRTSHNDVLGEADILASRRNTVILGDPGAGKTTTVKRLIYSLVNNDASKSDEHIDFPMLIVARNIVGGDSLFKTVFVMLGATLRNPTAKKDESARTKSDEEAIFENLVLSFLSKSKVLFVVDGIDEIPIESRLNLEKSLLKISNSATSCQIICTCRSGDYVRNLEGFDLCEILPLTLHEMHDIVSMWSYDPVKFIADIDGKNYVDLLNRPLYLTHILMIHNEYKSLPDRPSDIYRRIVLLATERWDRERSISRWSRYNSFSIEQRIDFISACAYELAYGRQQFSFSEPDLISVYNLVHGRFSLPPEECLNVVREIESHSGLVVEASSGKFQFSHLSIHEYLTANYLVRQPNIDKATRLLSVFPSPVAIATCLSSDPSDFFAHIILRIYKSGVTYTDPSQLASYLYRLRTEVPLFSESSLLGAAMLVLFGMLQDISQRYRENNTEDNTPGRIRYFLEITQNTEIKKSIALCLKFFRYDVSSSGQIFLELYSHAENDMPEFPKRLGLSGDWGEYVSALRRT